MKRHILFLKNVAFANALLATGKCVNEGNWILTCDDNMEDIQILQRAATKFLKGSNYKDYELCFANPFNYSDFTTIAKMNREELKKLIYEDYSVRNENPQYIVHDNKISIYSLIKNMLYEDCELDPIKFNYSIEEVEQILIENGFKNYSER